MFVITKQFTFEAAHNFPTIYPEWHKNRKMHGHSFRVLIAVAGPANENGMVYDFESLADRMDFAREYLDHTTLNEIDGLEIPTLENISKWIYDELTHELPDRITIVSVTVFRDTCGESCTYTPDGA